MSIYKEHCLYEILPGNMALETPVSASGSQGVEALTDKRGRTKLEAEMTELEKLRAENKLLKAQNKRQEMEMAFLKKLGEIERRRF